MVATAVLGVALCYAPAAQALDVVSPVDGTTVPSTPIFAFDFAEGSASIELSRTADLLQAGDRAGAFVAPVATNLIDFFGGSDGPPGLLTWSERRLTAGSYFWHAKLNNYDGVADVNEGGWTPIRAFRVLDEPPVIEGWTLAARRLKPKGRCDRVLVSGVIRVDDNDEVPQARLTVVIQTNSGILAEEGPMAAIAATDPTYERTFCTRSGTLAVSLEIEDPAGQTTRSETRVAIVPFAKRRTAAQIVRDEFRDFKFALRARDVKAGRKVDHLRRLKSVPPRRHGSLGGKRPSTRRPSP